MKQHLPDVSLVCPLTPDFFCFLIAQNYVPKGFPGIPGKVVFNYSL